jgi:hypothetical protein
LIRGFVICAPLTMGKEDTMLHFFIRPLTAVLTLLILPGIGAGFSMANAADCSPVRGFLEETQVTGPGCTSPVGLCTVAQLFGPLKGQARFIATALLPSADTPTTSVIFVVGDTTVVNARLGSKHGTLVIKNAAAFRTVGDGDLSDTQVVIGGTGDFAGASGSLRVSGTFVAGSGTASFEGSACFP